MIRWFTVTAVAAIVAAPLTVAVRAVAVTSSTRDSEGA